MQGSRCSAFEPLVKKRRSGCCHHVHRRGRRLGLSAHTQYFALSRDTSILILCSSMGRLFSLSQTLDETHFGCKEHGPYVSRIGRLRCPNSMEWARSYRLLSAHPLPGSLQSLGSCHLGSDDLLDSPIRVEEPSTESCNQGGGGPP